MHLPINFQIRLTYGQLRAASLVILVMFLFASSASSVAQEAGGFQLLNKIDAGFAGKAAQWDSIIRVYANRLFWLLAAADFCFMCATFVLDKKELDDMLASVIRKLMTLGFFWFVLKSSHQWIPQIINSFTLIGQKAGGTTATLPDGVAAAGYDAALAAFQALSDLGVTEKIGAVVPTVLMALLIFLAFLWVAGQLLIAKVETSIAVGAGIILLGFGGSKWTTDMSSKYMQYSVATGLKLMLTYLLIGMGQTLFNDIHIVGGDKFFESLLVTTGTALTYAFLATKIPAMASAMMSGSPSLTAGDMTGAVIGAAAAVAGLGAAGMAAGKAGMGAASGGAAAATGVGQALQAGIASGQDFGKSGANLAAHALGEVGKHGMGLASTGIGDMLKGGASSFQNRVDESAGGRIATSIQAGRGGSMAGVEAPAGTAQSSESGAASHGVSSTSSADSGSAAGSPSTTGFGTGNSQGTLAHGGEAAASAAAGATNGADGGGDGSAVPGVHAPAESGAPAGKGAVSDVAKAASAGGGQGATLVAPTSSAPLTQSAPNGTGAAAGQAAAQTASASNSVPTPQRSALAGNAAVPASSASGPVTQPVGGGAPGARSSALAGNSAAVPQAPSPSSGPQPGDAGSMTTNTGAGVSGGDASTGAVTGGNQPSKNNGGSSERRSLHERIQGLQGYVPDDAAHSATLHIDMKHTE